MGEGVVLGGFHLLLSLLRWHQCLCVRVCVYLLATDLLDNSLDNC